MILIHKHKLCNNQIFVIKVKGFSLIWQIGMELFFSFFVFPSDWFWKRCSSFWQKTTINIFSKSRSSFKKVSRGFHRSHIIEILLIIFYFPNEKMGVFARKQSDTLPLQKHVSFTIKNENSASSKSTKSITSFLRQLCSARCSLVEKLDWRPNSLCVS